MIALSLVRPSSMSWCVADDHWLSTLCAAHWLEHATVSKPLLKYLPVMLFCTGDTIVHKLGYVDHCNEPAAYLFGVTCSEGLTPSAADRLNCLCPCIM